MKKKVIIVQRIFSNYRKPIFDRLNDVYDFKLIHAKNTSGITQVTAQYSKTVKSFNYGKKETTLFLCVLPVLLKTRPDVIIHEFNPSIISLYISFIYARVFNKKIIVWGHGYNRRLGFSPQSSFKSRIRYWFMKKADAILVYGEEGKKELSKFIFPGKIFVAQNTLDTDALISLRKKFEKKGIRKIKEELGIRHKYNLVYIGRLLKEKKPDLLIDLFLRLRPYFDNELAIHIIGDGDMYDKLLSKIQLLNLGDSVFLQGKIDDSDLSGKYLFISDLLVNPGYLGLSVNHAFSFLTPVISFKNGYQGVYHSPEVEYVENNLTGFLVDDFEDMLVTIKDFLKDSNKKMFMQEKIENCLKTKCSLDKMLSGFQQAINYIK